MAEHPINGIMDCAMENLKSMVDVNTIIGEPVTTSDGTVMIPVSKVSFGLAAGGSEFSSKKNTDSGHPFGGGVGAGVTISPVAFLIANKDQVKLMSVDGEEAASKLVDYIPVMVNKISDIISSKKKDNSIE